MNAAAESQAGGSRASGFSAGFFTVAALGALVVLGLPFASAWSGSPDLGHGWSLPWLIGWLLWERRSAVVSAQPCRVTWMAWAALAVLGGAVLVMRLLLGAYPLLPTALWALGGVFVVFALGAGALLGGGKAVRALAVPVALVLTGLPWPSAVENAVVLPLREVLTTITVEVLNFAGVPSLAYGTVIQLPGGTVGVDEACGGMRSLQASIMIALFVGEAAALGWGRRIKLLGVALAAAVTGNLLRIGLLTVAAHSGGEARLLAWHDPAGYVALACTLAVVGWLGWRWGGGAALLAASPDGNWAKSPRVSARALAWAVSALVIVASVELVAERWYAVETQAVASRPGWRVSWPTTAEGYHTDPLGKTGEELLRADDYAAASWQTPGGGERSAYFIEWRTGQKARFLPLLHNPEICLSMAGSQLVGKFATPPVRVGGLELPFTAYEFLTRGRPAYVFSLLWDVDEARAFVPPPAVKGWMAEFRSRWADVEARRARVRVKVCTYQVIGPTSREAAAAMFRREMEGGFLVEAAAGAPQ